MTTQALLSEMWHLRVNTKPAAVTELNGLRSIACQTDPVVIVYNVQPASEAPQRETPIKRPPPPAQLKKVSAPSSSQPEPDQVLIAGKPSTDKVVNVEAKECDLPKPTVEKPLISKRDPRKRDACSPPPADAFPKPQKRRLMVKRLVPNQEVGEVRAGHRQSDGSFQQASLSRFVAPTAQQRSDIKTPLDAVPRMITPAPAVSAVEPLPPLRRVVNTNALRLPTPQLTGTGTLRPRRFQRSSCSTAVATDAVAAAASLIFGDDYTTPIPIRRRNTTAVDSTLHVPTFTPQCENPATGAVAKNPGYRWSTPINPEGHEENTAGGGKAVPTLPSLQAPRRKRDAGANPEPLSSGVSAKSGCPIPVVIRKRPRPNSCASESAEDHALKRTRTTSLL